MLRKLHGLGCATGLPRRLGCFANLLRGLGRVANLLAAVLCHLTGDSLFF
jgi:hypothetical protein